MWRNPMKQCTSVSVVVCLTVGVGSAQSLRDRAKQEGGRATTAIDVDYGIMKPSELMPASDLVLRGRIIAATPHLRADEAAVVTDYVIAPINIIKQRRPATVSRPGESTQITIR